MLKKGLTFHKVNTSCTIECDPTDNLYSQQVLRLSEVQLYSLNFAEFPKV